jgi:formylmethanofuran dehydrogenase subunit C
VTGSAGVYAARDLAGGTLPGKHRGMRGGVVIMRGNVADPAAIRTVRRE